MGYTIVIGDMVSISDEEGLRDTIHVTEDVDAPTFSGDDATHNTNVRKPKYSEWDSFLQTVGLYDLFKNKEDGLMRTHPDIVPLCEEHYQQINGAHLLFSTLEEGTGTAHSIQYVRLAWLHFWVRWALDNCENSAIWNY